MDNDQIETIFQSMGSLVLKVAEATSFLMEQGVANLASPYRAEQRGKAQAIHQAAESLRGVLGSLGPNQ